MSLRELPADSVDLFSDGTLYVKDQTFFPDGRLIFWRQFKGFIFVILTFFIGFSNRVCVSLVLEENENLLLASTFVSTLFTYLEKIPDVPPMSLNGFERTLLD